MGSQFIPKAESVMPTEKKQPEGHGCALISKSTHKSRLFLGISLDAFHIEVVSPGVVDYRYGEILHLQSPDRLGP